ncbi:MAG: type II secretion system protein GspE, partial [Oscillospiraceae bacterium]|nr:type II secretion system protein GspE [Oscillospiraceae bacterium]
SKALAAKLRVPYVDLANVEIDEDAVRRIPENFARKYTVIAINVQGRRLIVAANEPIGFYILEDIKMQTGMDTIPVVATKSAITKAIDSMYDSINK